MGHTLSQLRKQGMNLIGVGAVVGSAAFLLRPMLPIEVHGQLLTFASAVNILGLQCLGLATVLRMVRGK